MIAAAERGWTVMIEQTDGDPEREREVLDGVREQRIDGLVFSPITVGPEELAARTDTTALVLLGERVLDGPTHHVAIDNQRAGRELTEHLLSLGHTRIATIGRQDNPSANTAHLRLSGYRQALEAAGLAYDEAFAPPTPAYRRADGARLMRQLLDLPQPPQAVLCCNDLLALGALRTALSSLSSGLRVPEDVAVAGGTTSRTAATAPPPSPPSPRQGADRARGRRHARGADQRHPAEPAGRRRGARSGRRLPAGGPGEHGARGAGAGVGGGAPLRACAVAPPTP
ncbi:substrate-binding domain-containing protein [Streptomyces sp. NPDC054802]